MHRLFTVLFLCLAHASGATAKMPAVLEQAAKELGAPSGDLEKAHNEPVAWIGSRDQGDRQITALAVARIPVSHQRLLADLFARNGLLTKQALEYGGVFSEPAAQSDMARYKLPSSDLELLADCEVGECKVKMSAQGAAHMQELDWDAPNIRELVDVRVREAVVDFVNRYQKQGHEALPTYGDQEEPFDAADGVEQLLTQVSGRISHVEALRTHLFEYPKIKTPGVEDRILWLVRDFGYRPVTAIIHSVSFAPEGGAPEAAIGMKTLYASHYLHARLQLVGLYTDPSDPEVTWVGMSDRILFDDDIGGLKRRLLKSGILEDTLRRLALLIKEYQ